VQGLEENGYTVNYINTVGDLTRENSLAGCEDMLTAHDNIDIFYGTAGTSALGAFDATQNAGRTEVMVVGFDGEDEEIMHIDAGTNYIATICQDPAGEARVTVEAIKTVLEGGTVQGGHETPAKVYGKGVGYVTKEELTG
jgi:ribose transport system substrate-binding protein